MACTTVQGLKTPWQCRVKTSYQITVLSACANAACQPRNNISIVTDKSTPEQRGVGPCGISWWFRWDWTNSAVAEKSLSIIPHWFSKTTTLTWHAQAKYTAAIVSPTKAASSTVAVLSNWFHLHDTIRYDTRCYFNVRSKADISQLNLPHGTDD